MLVHVWPLFSTSYSAIHLIDIHNSRIVYHMSATISFISRKKVTARKGTCAVFGQVCRVEIGCFRLYLLHSRLVHETLGTSHSLSSFLRSMSTSTSSKRQLKRLSLLNTGNSPHTSTSLVTNNQTNDDGIQTISSSSRAVASLRSPPLHALESPAGSGSESFSRATRRQSSICYIPKDGLDQDLSPASQGSGDSEQRRSIRGSILLEEPPHTAPASQERKAMTLVEK